MAGTQAGGKSAAQTNIKRYGSEFYREIGRKGGLKGTTGGFWADRELAKRAGRIGGLKSKRTKKDV